MTHALCPGDDVRARRMTTKCPRCWKQLTSTAVFCPRCGTSVRGVQPRAVPVGGHATGGGSRSRGRRGDGRGTKAMVIVFIGFVLILIVLQGANPREGWMHAPRLPSELKVKPTTTFVGWPENSEGSVRSPTDPDEDHALPHASEVVEDQDPD